MIKLIEESVELHEQLNQRIWTPENKLKPDVKQAILDIVEEFKEYSDVPLKVADIHLTGSNASYNYTKYSDLDIHMVVNFELLDASPEILQTMYNSAKTAFNKTYDITVKGIGVELYVEDIKSATIANGIYSVVKDEWIKFPEKIQVPDIDITKEVQQSQTAIQKVLASNNLEGIEQIINELYLIRKNSLALNGEFGKGNLLFKEIRNLGLLDELKQARINLKSKQLSIESTNGITRKGDD